MLVNDGTPRVAGNVHRLSRMPSTASSASGVCKGQAQSCSARPLPSCGVRLRRAIGSVTRARAGDVCRPRRDGRRREDPLAEQAVYIGKSRLRSKRSTSGRSACGASGLHRADPLAEQAVSIGKIRLRSKRSPSGRSACGASGLPSHARGVRQRPCRTGLGHVRSRLRLRRRIVRQRRRCRGGVGLVGRGDIRVSLVADVKDDAVPQADPLPGRE
jgi:hypothetical protein